MITAKSKKIRNYIVCGITEDISIKLHRRVTKFMYMYSMIHSDNDTVRFMTTFYLSTEASFLAENFRYIMYTYNIPMFTWYKELVVSAIKVFNISQFTVRY